MISLHLPVRLRRFVALAAPLLVGAVFFVILRRTRSGPEESAGAESARSVRVIEVSSLSVAPRAVGYGTGIPARTWEAAAEVSGKVTTVHPRLKKGAIIGAGTVVVEIDPSEYQLQVAQMEAEVESLQAQLSELEIRKQLDTAVLKTERRSLELKENELARQQRLFEQNVVSEAEIESSERDLLTQTLRVQAAEKAVRLLPSQRRVLQANLSQAHARLDEARIRLSHTAVTVPFECRVSDVRVERNQFVSRGQRLAAMDGVEATEVHAQVPADDLRVVIRASGEDSLLELSRARYLGDALDISAVVRFQSGDFVVTWDARVARISDVVDPRTRTIGVIVEVPRSYATSTPGVRPPLMKGMYCEVLLHGAPQPDRIVIPRTALRPDGTVFVLGPDARLRKRSVVLAWEQGSIAVVRDGLTVGDRVVVSDVVPAVEGMRLLPVNDTDLAARMAAAAAGEVRRHD